MRIYAVYAVTETYYSGYDSDPKPGIPIQRLTKRKFKVKAKAKVETVAGYVVGDRSMFRIDPIVKRNGCGYINYTKDYDLIYAVDQDQDQDRSVTTIETDTDDDDT